MARLTAIVVTLLFLMAPGNKAFAWGAVVADGANGAATQIYLYAVPGSSPSKIKAEISALKQCSKNCAIQATFQKKCAATALGKPKTGSATTSLYFWAIGSSIDKAEIAVLKLCRAKSKYCGSLKFNCDG